MSEEEEDFFFMPIADDMHCHLRQGNMLEFTVNAVKKGGCDRVLVMPNTQPIISSCEDAKIYRQELIKYDDSINYLMTLYLNKNIKGEDIIKNHEHCNLQGIKIYPSHVTTNSADGINDLESFYPIFDILQKLNKSVHIHCEETNTNPLFAEKKFITTHINDLAINFPHLKIVLEHISTDTSISVITKFPNIAGTITPHHLCLTMMDFLNTKEYNYDMDFTNIEKYITNVYNYCKPIPKSTEDKEALINIIKKNCPKVYLGSDSAPHYKKDKNDPHFKPGIYTQPFLISYVAHIFHKINCFHKIQDFCCKNGAAFLNLTEKKLTVGETALCIKRKEMTIPEEYFGVVPFLASQTLHFQTSYDIYTG